MTLKVVVKSSVEAFGLKMEVDRYGLRPGAGYTWRYTPKVIVWLDNNTIVPATAEFEFDDAKWATYFQLKWGV